LLFVLSIGMIALVAIPEVQAGGSADVSVRARAEAAIELPHLAIDLRAQGVEPPEVEQALVHVAAHRLPATEVRLIFDSSLKSVRVHGPMPHFGRVVRVKLEKGYRGPKLIREIRIEHKHPGPPGHPPGLAKGQRRGHPPGRAKGHRKHHRRHGPGARVEIEAHGPRPPRPPHLRFQGGVEAKVEAGGRGGGEVKVERRGGGGHRHRGHPGRGKGHQRGRGRGHGRH
jgi:hypothetical protein